jgi:AAA domain-containing protein
LNADVREFPPVGAYADDSRASTSTPALKLSGTNFADMQPRLNDDYLVKTMIGRGAFIGIVGPSGSGKTFFAGNLATHIAANLSYRGLRVNGGLVVYVALEGAASAENRFVAARADLKLDKAPPLKLTPGPVNLREVSDVATLVNFVRAAESEHGVKVAAVFVDTLSRAMAGGDENSSEDMTALIAGADQVRLATGATVVMVHHTGKDESRGARGHSSFRAALDTEIEVTTNGGLHVANVTKQRDLPTGASYAFSLEVVEIGRDRDDEAVTTCVVRAADAPATKRQAPTGKNQATLLAALQEWVRTHAGARHISSLDLRALAKAQGIAGKRLTETVAPLERLGWLQPAVGGFTLGEDFSS